MQKEEALQKVNEYCNEKSYTNATLTDSFKDKFAEHFAKRYPDADAEDENVLGEMKFALNTAFAGASTIITDKNKEFETKENDYKSQIEELQKKAKQAGGKVEPEISKELKERLEHLEQFENEETKKNKFKNIVRLAKQGIRQDLHDSFDSFASDYDVDLKDDDEEQAKWLTKRFQEIFKHSIGDIKPLAPQVKQKQEEEFLASIPKVLVQ